VSRLTVLYEEVDARARAMEDRLPFGLACRRGCSDCCRDGLRVSPLEADHIRARHPRLLAEGEPHPPGACAFLDRERACRIYPDRPYVCRTQGLPLRWEEPEAGTESRDICPIHDPGPPLLALAPEDCWELGPTEGRLAELQRESSGRFPAPEDRVLLRSLFARCGR
jgi:Fe-S-cluster containining protein